MRLATALFSFLILAGAAPAQKPDYVKWSLRVDPSQAAPGSKVLAHLEGQIEPGWHLYSMTTAAANPTTIKVTPSEAIERWRVLQPTPRRAFDNSFQQETETFENRVDFLIELELKKDAAAGPAVIAAEVRYQTCNDRLCIPPIRRNAQATLSVDPGAKSATVAIPAGYSEFTGVRPAQAATGGAPATADSQGFLGFLVVAFGFGLAAIFTPCVFPMIPITMSYFLNRQAGSKRDSVFQATVFCLGIIVLFSGMGLMATAVLGPFGVVQLGSSPWINGFIALIFLAFGLSLLGAFEITIPSALLTKLDRASQKGGTLGTLLMGLTFSLASFACVGPFVGTLLAASVQSGGIRPLLGMVSFSTGLALPFFLLALFPSYLKRMPKSGGWLARVKVVMGFVILAVMFKYLASVDQALQLELLTRERFLAAWIVLTAMAGLYLLGFVRLEGIGKDENMGLGRLLSGVAFLIFAISLIPGMFGGRLGDLDAYVPLASNPISPGSGAASSEGGLVWMKNQLREALARARAEGKLVFVNFTGYACSNCHWMKANMFTRPEIAGVMKNYVLVELYTDGTDEESRLNQELEQSKFNTIAIPYYAILDPDENVVATFPSRTTDPKEYLAFLQKGMEARPIAATTAAAPVRDVKRPESAPLGGLASLEGGAFDTSGLNGKVVVVNFWATWCVPCIQEIPSFNRIHQELADKGVVVLGVSMDEDGAPLVKSFLKKHPMTYQVALGNEQVGSRYQVNQLPTTVVFDRDGKPLKRFEGFTPEESLQAAVKTAL